VGGEGAGGSAGPAYGSSTAPTNLGSGGGYWDSYGSKPGGGAVRIQAGDTVTINGMISADSALLYAGATGSGGSVYITAGTLAGSGTIRAEGGEQTHTTGGGGGGGRIALHATDMSGFSGRVSAAAGVAPDIREGDMGTVYLSSGDVIANSLLLPGGANLSTDGSAWTPASLTVANYYLRLDEGMDVDVSGDVQVLDGARLELLDNADLSCVNMTLSGSNATYGSSWLSTGTNEYDVYNNTVTCSGDLTMGADTQVKLYPGSTLTCSGDIDLVTGSTLYTFCHPTSGVTPSAVSARDFTMQAGSTIDADGTGYARGPYAGGDGYGPSGAGWHGYGKEKPASRAGGGAHGGQGGDASNGAEGGDPYGNYTNPVTCGAGGGTAGSSYQGGDGGGYVKIESSRIVTIDGRISADGEPPQSATKAGAAGGGGGIWITCETIEGSGTIRANGGDNTTQYSGGGGGGRIAIWCSASNFTGVVLVYGGTGYPAASTAEVGTVYWNVDAPPSGTLILIR